MMWPILTKGESSAGPPVLVHMLIHPLVQYERLPQMLRQGHIWRQVALSIILNWIVGPFVSNVACMLGRKLTPQIMLAVAWATLPDQPTYRTGVIMVGLAR